jgi:hypothetical protein
MDPITIIALINTVGIPAARKIIELYTKQKPDDVTALEWLELLRTLKSYSELRAELVKP